jgi:hypothetical protein
MALIQLTEDDRIILEEGGITQTRKSLLKLMEDDGQDICRIDGGEIPIEKVRRALQAYTEMKKILEVIK